MEEIADYIGDSSPRASAAYVSAIFSACDRLADFPRSGRVIKDKYRLWVVRNHLIIYTFDDQSSKATVIAVLDGRRDLAALLETFDENPTDY